jgi:hypothetical protein
VGVGAALATGWPWSSEPTEPANEVADEPQPAAAPPVERTEEPEDQPEAVEEEPGASASAETPAMRRRRRPRRRAQRMAMSAPAMEDTAMHRLPEWVGFER